MLKRSMNKDFTATKLLGFPPEKQFKVLYDLASHIEVNKLKFSGKEFNKLKKYHSYLKTSEVEKIQKLNKEFEKIKSLDKQFQIYLMNLERLLGQSKKDYDFLIKSGDTFNTEQKKFPIVCVLDSIRSAHNVGSFFRNAECFAVEKLLLCGLSPTPDSIHVQKTAMGCDKRIQWEYCESAVTAVKNLKELGYKIIAVETAKEASELNSFTHNFAKIALIFGHEQFGISFELLETCDEVISIELYGEKNSLNVSISNGIVLNKITSSYAL